eukprot:g67038.t1
MGSSFSGLFQFDAASINVARLIHEIFISVQPKDKEVGSNLNSKRCSQWFQEWHRANYNIMLLGDFNFQVSATKTNLFDSDLKYIDHEFSGQVSGGVVRRIPTPHGNTTPHADEFVRNLESVPLVLLTGLLGKADILFVLDVDNYVTWPQYFIPFSDHKLITVDVKMQKSNSTKLKELRKKKLELLRQLARTRDGSERKKIVVALKEFNLLFKNKLKELRNKRKEEDLRQVVADMKANPRKAWDILRRFLGKESDSPRQIENN